MDDIYPILNCLDRPGGKVLATIVDVEGSAYKKEGSAMVFFEDGTSKGMLSAGCLEEDLGFRAAEVIRKGTITTVQYDLRDETDFSWGQGAGCNGIITILLELIDDRLSADLYRLKNLLQANIPVLGFKKIGELGEYLFLPEEGEPFGWWDDEIPEDSFEGRSGMIHEDQIFRHLYQPKPRLILFGAGSDVRPLVKMAAGIGFSVMICDWREEFCKKEYFPDADRVMVGFPHENVDKIHFNSRDFVIVASHHFQKDQEALLQLPINRVRYVGVLGPRERTKRLFRNQKVPENIHSPVGLPICAKGQEEIAISIIAEMIEVWRNPVHERVGMA
jgi:xanthine dehydrogenase accessory factor